MCARAHVCVVSVYNRKRERERVIQGRIEGKGKRYSIGSRTVEFPSWGKWVREVESKRTRGTRRLGLRNSLIDRALRTRIEIERFACIAPEIKKQFKTFVRDWRIIF